MEIHQVRYFLAVVETLNFTKAAERCNVSQPALTRAIQLLEHELGGLLFRRERANTHLTELGRMVLPHLKQSFDAMAPWIFSESYEASVSVSMRMRFKRSSSGGSGPACEWASPYPCS